jgi:hypothetical protein
MTYVKCCQPKELPSNNITLEMFSEKRSKIALKMSNKGELLQQYFY